MKLIKNISIAAVTLSVLLGPVPGFAADKTPAKPYKLEKCLVSDEKLGEMGKPYEFEYKGQEIKLCCKNCRKDFDKNPDKYLKKMEQEEKQAAKGAKQSAK